MLVISVAVGIFPVAGIVTAISGTSSALAIRSFLDIAIFRLAGKISARLVIALPAVAVIPFAIFRSPRLVIGFAPIFRSAIISRIRVSGLLIIFHALLSAVFGNLSAILRRLGASVL